MSRWSSGYLLDYEPHGSGSIPEVRNLEICILRIPSHRYIDNICKFEDTHQDMYTVMITQYHCVHAFVARRRVG